MNGMFRYPRSTARKWVSLLIVLSLFLPQVCEAGLALGHLNFSYPPAKELENPLHLREGLKSFGYLSSVGGIAFGAVAAPAEGYKVAALFYDSGRPDGQRLSVTLVDAKSAKRTVTASIYDWQLVPIAKFASGDQHACFTLFGKLIDEADEKERRSRGEKILNYHPAFADTLLGLRLFQADILILDPAAADLPRENSSSCSAGESAPDVDANLARLARVHDAIMGLEESHGGRFSSYVICDQGQRVTFGAVEKELVLTGNPFWHLWRYKTTDPDAFRKLQERANQQGNRMIQAEMKRDSRVLPRAEFEAIYNGERAQARFEEIVRGILSDTAIEDIPRYSNLLSEEIRLADGVNPAVYDALLKTMRFAAFFRYVMETEPAIFSNFLSSLKGVEIAPDVKTPTAMSAAEKK
jgi:hypothetical protein